MFPGKNSNFSSNKIFVNFSLKNILAISPWKKIVNFFLDEHIRQFLPEKIFSDFSLNNFLSIFRKQLSNFPWKKLYQFFPVKNLSFRCWEKKLLANFVSQTIARLPLGVWPNRLYADRKFSWSTVRARASYRSDAICIQWRKKKTEKKISQKEKAEGAVRWRLVCRVVSCCISSSIRETKRAREHQRRGKRRR